MISSGLMPALFAIELSEDQHFDPVQTSSLKSDGLPVREQTTASSLLISRTSAMGRPIRRRASIS